MSNDAGAPEVPADRPVVIVSNRGPLAYRLVDGRLESRRGGGGLVSGLAPLVEEGRAMWIAVALDDADRMAAEQAGGPGDAVDGALPGVHLVALDREDQRRYYDVIANETLWFVHHGLYDLVREPAYDAAWRAAWDAYRRVNHTMAGAVCRLAPADAVVLVQDYHLALLAPWVRASRPDLRLVHFHHTPFAGPEGMRTLPGDVAEELLRSLASHDACGFHTATWAEQFEASLRRHVHEPMPVTVFHSTLNSDLDDLTRTATSPECDAAVRRLEQLAGDRRIVARVDRMELSKNIVRGFAAWESLLARRPDLHDRVVFVACCYPSRLGVPAYARYRDEVVAAAERVNDRFGTDSWRPVELLTDDDHPRSVAVLRRADVLVVNPVRDGLNLVAKEGPMVNERDGQLVLSTEAGAWSELLGAADGVNPFDVAATAAAIESALDRPTRERSVRASMLRRAALTRTPADWLADQLAAAG
jgi:trehalose 6-phosphate synthase